MHRDHFLKRPRWGFYHPGSDKQGYREGMVSEAPGFLPPMGIKLTHLVSPSHQPWEGRPTSTIFWGSRIFEYNKMFGYLVHYVSLFLVIFGSLLQIQDSYIKFTLLQKSPWIFWEGERLRLFVWVSADDSGADSCGTEQRFDDSIARLGARRAL